MAWNKPVYLLPAAFVAASAALGYAVDSESSGPPPAEISASRAHARPALRINAPQAKTREELAHLKHLRHQVRNLLEGSISAAAAPPFGYPTLTHVRHCDSYTMGFDGYHKVPAWVYERYDGHGQHPRTPLAADGSPAPGAEGDAAPSGGNRKRSYFHSDGSLPPYLQVQPTVYQGSGLDRGHMAPAAGHKFSQWGMDDTFRMSNVAPQVGKGFNRDYWARLEGHLRRLSKRHGATVHVFSGPVFTPSPVLGGADSAAAPAAAPASALTAPARASAADTHRRMRELYGPDGMKSEAALWWTVHPWLGKGRSGGLTAVPNGFYKVVLVENFAQTSDVASSERGDPVFHVAAFLLPNARIAPETPLTQFVVPLSALQAAVGFEFFPAVDCSAVESMDEILLRAGFGEGSDAKNASSVSVLGLGGGVVQHLCSAQNGCQLPRANWWHKKAAISPPEAK